MPKLSKPLFGVLNGEVYPRQFEAGDDCPEELMDAALALDALEPEAAPDAGKATKAGGAPEKK